MPQNTPITIKDGATTPADHVFAPISTTGGAALFETTNQASLVGREVLNIGAKRPAAGGRTTLETKLQLDLPKVVQGVGAQGEVVDTKLYTNRVIIQIVTDPRSSVQDRKNARVMAANLLLNASVQAAVDNAESFW